MLEHIAGKESAGFFYYGEVFAQEILIKSVFVMSPDMGAEPRSTHRPDCCGYAQVLRCAVAEQIGVMMGNEAFKTVHIPSHLFAVRKHGFKMLEKRHMAIRKRADLRRPVVHFGVNIYCVLGTPCGISVLIPDSLKRRRLCSRAGAGNKQVSAEVEIQLGKLVILPF